MLTGTDMGGHYPSDMYPLPSLVLGFPLSRVPPFSRFGFPAQLFLGVSFGLLQGLRPRRRKELGSAIWTERGIQCWNVVMTGSAT